MSTCVVHYVRSQVREGIVGIDCSGCERIGSTISNAIIDVRETAIRITSSQGVLQLQHATIKTASGPAVVVNGQFIDPRRHTHARARARLSR